VESPPKPIDLMSAFEKREWVREQLGEDDWDSPDAEHLVLNTRHPTNKEWVIKVVFEIAEDHAVVSHLAIYPVAEWAPAGGLTDEIRRAVSLSALRKLAQDRLGRRDAYSTIGVDPAKFQGNPRRGRRGRNDLDYAHIAQRYEQLCENENVDYVAQTLGEELHLNESTARTLVWKARKRGLLTEAKAGHAGGRLTDRARRLLDAEVRKTASTSSDPQNP